MQVKPDLLILLAALGVELGSVCCRMVDGRVDRLHAAVDVTDHGITRGDQAIDCDSIFMPRASTAAKVAYSCVVGR